jgi:hypothetical protein
LFDEEELLRWALLVRAVNQSIDYQLIAILIDYFNYQFQLIEARLSIIISISIISCYSISISITSTDQLVIDLQPCCWWLMSQYDCYKLACYTSLISQPPIFLLEILYSLFGGKPPPCFFA